ncbi:ABC transporter permease [Kribbella solani]|uniref:ABC transporter permease n=1 Tax=Kribbella solani TaxID=236067 RepID=UPI0029BF2A9F|nr:ABC transporter permease [Kribbella solani]MDX2972490.1 ABC transporter permease [Kribbella solani]
MGNWGPPLRIARRTMRRSLGRTLLVAALIGLPVLAATWIGVVMKTADPQGEAFATRTIGAADARLDVTQYGKLAPRTGPPSLYNEPPAAEGYDKAVRTPATFDPLTLLPAGSTVARAFTDAGMTEIQNAGVKTSVTLMTGDGSNPLTNGTLQLDQGRFPTTSEEIAISPSLADKLGLRGPSGTIESTTGKKYAVVGLARVPAAQNMRAIFATPDTTLYEPDAGRTVQYLVDLPASVNPDRLGDALRDQGVDLLPRAIIVDPPADPFNGGGDAGSYAAMALVLGFGILEIVLLAGTAFAVGARRQTRELGLVLAAGGTPRDVRRIVAMQGLFAGLVGVLGGLVLAGVAVFAGRPLWERMTNTIFAGWQVPWVMIFVIAALGLGAGLAAAAIPAINAGRQAPMTALAGRFEVSAKAVRVRIASVILLAGGLVCVFAGSAMIASALQAAKERVTVHSPATVTPTGPIALVLLGITATIVALVWMLPGLVVKVAGLARGLPLSGRMAMRDAARHRHRTGPATAAIMMAVAGTAAVAFAASNSIAASAADYVATAHDGDASLRFIDGVEGQRGYSPQIVTDVARLLPVRNTYEIGYVRPHNVKANKYGYVPSLMADGPATKDGLTGFPLQAVDPAMVARFGEYGEKAAAALRAGLVVVPEVALKAGQKVALRHDDMGNAGAVGSVRAASFGATPPVQLLREYALIAPQAARALGTIEVVDVHYELTREPSAEELAAVSRLLGRDDMLQVEKGYQSPARLFLIGILGAATVVTLLGVAISVSLSAAEGRADLATLAAIGAPPRRRRSLAAAQAWVLGQLGCVLGVGVGALYGYTAHAAFGSPHFVIPWAEIAGIVIVVPLFAGLLAWLLTRSRLPMVSRID